MPAYLKKTRSEILHEALTKVQKHTAISYLGPGSIARALIEAVTTELGDFYDLMDYNANQTLITTATGSALDMLGSLYSTPRKEINDLAAIDKKIGAFIFYLTTPHNAAISIPKGTNIYTDADSYVGRVYTFSTTEETILPAGRTRAYASIQPNFVDSVYTAGVGTLTSHTFQGAPVTIYCSNPKPISPQAAMETDEQYRIRLIKSVRVASKGTLEAVRFAALGVPGVRDVKINAATYGLGSFEAIIVPERDSSAGDVLNRVNRVMDDTRPLGVRMYIKSPTYVSFNADIGIITPTITGVQSADQIVKRASVAVARYINSLLPGSELRYNQLIQIIMDSSEAIVDVVIKNYSVDGSEILRRNYKPANDQQIVLGNVSIDIARS